jgi:hypothetical protein
MTAAQLEFITFAVGKPRPFSWRWLDADGEVSLGPRTHRYFIARKMVCGVEVHSSRLTVTELDGMASLWSAPLVELNDAGRAALLVEVVA